jgi:hypothetical protein
MIKEIGGRYTGSNDNGTRVFLKTCVLKDRKIKILIPISGRFNNSDTFAGGGSNSREYVCPVLHGNISTIRSGRLQLYQDNIAGFEV